MKTHSTDYPEYKTIRQWALKGFLPKDGAEGIELWANRMYQDKFIYYSPDEVAAASKDQLDAFFKDEKERAKALAKEAREKRKREKQKQARKEEYRNRIDLVAQISKPYLKVIKEQHLQISGSKPNIVVLDIETTGLDSEDELLQVSMIDGYGNVLFDSYFKPSYTEEWYEAESINHISPRMVADAPAFYEKLPEINAILAKADVIIGYNVGFDISFLQYHGAVVPSYAAVEDVMLDFARIYGEWSEYHGSYKWKSLDFAASYYNYDFSHGPAHNSLSDCHATLFVYNKINSNNRKEI